VDSASPIPGVEMRVRVSLWRWLLSLCLTSVLVGCGIGSGSSDSGTGPGTDGGTPTNQLFIELSGQTKYRADEGVSLSYTLSGDSAEGATVTYDGPVELTHDATAKTITGEALLPGTYVVKVSASSGTASAEDEISLYIDANFGGRYGGGGESEFTLTMGRSLVTETDENNYVLTRSGTLFWHAQATDETEFVNLLCVADVVVSGDEASGTGLCKELVDGQLQVRTVTSLLVTYKETGALGLTYSYEETGDSFDIDFAVAGEAYVSPDLDLSGVYRSSLIESLDYLSVAQNAITGDSYNLEVPRCGVTATLSPYDTEFITATEGDGSIIPAESIVIDNCDLSDQDGYAVSVGEATGSGQTGLLLILQSGISDSVIRFDLYARRGSEYADPLSKLRYVRVCYEGLPTSQAEIYDVTEADCEALSGG
jgi:hypothetical protein